MASEDGCVCKLMSPDISVCKDSENCQNFPGFVLKRQTSSPLYNPNLFIPGGLGGSIGFQPGVFPGQTKTQSPGASQPGVFPGQTKTQSPGASQPGVFPGQTKTQSPGASQPGVFPGQSKTQSPGASQPGVFPGQSKTQSPGASQTGNTQLPLSQLANQFGKSRPKESKLYCCSSILFKRQLHVYAISLVVSMYVRITIIFSIVLP